MRHPHHLSLIQFDWKKIVSLCIRKRKQIKLSLEDISYISGVPKPKLLEFENGLTNIKLETVFRIVEALRIEQDSSPHFSFLEWQEFIEKSIQRRKDLGLSLNDIKTSAAASYKVIKKFENGEKNIGLNSIIKILRVLDISQSRCFQKKPVKKSYISKRHKKYGTGDIPEVLGPLLNWEKIVEICTLTRRKLNMTQGDLERRAGVSKTTVVNFESGLTNLNINTILNIFRALDLNSRLDSSDLSKYFAILDWDAFVKTSLKRKEELCLSRNELAKFANLTFPVVTNFEKAKTSISLNSVIKILKTLGLLENTNI
ncbi:MAG: hypothetical protein A3J37_01770 [Alphaproteobacteria bacterium RIFCSPHIGHO2_12_FULL_45_9]|nr:MAG: hypothetical protein A3J37_01770 [Alphaproteobacteria bacterium RIFCSPHIGHO2_12_FULL_45_9]